VSDNRLTYDGLDELRYDLRRLPAELVGEASGIVTSAADGAKSDMVYPRRSGDLADHLKVEAAPPGPYGAGVIVKNTSKHALIFENGTEARHYFTVNGVRKETGRMPPGHVFVPAVVRRRRQMYQQLKAMLTRHGLEVSGDA
jgi:hypothetical protein